MNELGAKPDYGKPLIAVVEDNPDNRLVVRAMLKCRFDLVEFSSGPEALANLPERRPALVLLDVSLPGMDGCEVLRRIRSEEGLRNLPVVALTAHAMVGDRERFLADGFDGYVAKPILDPKEFLHTIESLLAG